MILRDIYKQKGLKSDCLMYAIPLKNEYKILPCDAFVMIS